uniref:Retrotransposon gag domain-containing protein n=1 Tax=Arundo donax TaxID=35708 RepID=A0A0A9HQ49_ARUDO
MEEEKVWLTSLHLDGTAAQWYFQMERDFSIVLWPRFVEYVNLRFGPPIRSNALGELKELHRTRSVEDYQRQFLALLCRCDHLRPQHQIDLFTSGLGQPLGSDIEMQRPFNLQMAMSLARTFERRHAVSEVEPKGVQAHTTSRSSGYLPKSPGPSGSTTTPTPTKAVDSTVSPKPRYKRLLPEDMAAKRRNNECYFCTEKYTPDHKCTTKAVFLVEIEEDGDHVEGRNWASPCTP